MINEVKYVPEGTNSIAPEVDGMKYCVIRTYSAGVHIGYVKSRNSQDMILLNSRRLWNWTEGASLSQVAMEGCKSNKFAMTLPEIELTDVIEVIPCSGKAKIVLDGIKEWKN